MSKKWWDANRKFSIPMMVEAFVGGDKFHGFNLNGHTYYTIGEWVRLWEYLGHVMAPSIDGAPAMGEPREVRLTIRGDMAFLTAEAMFSAKIAPTSDVQSASLPGPGETLKMPFRTTEVFVREDHEGNPVWKMWHFHASPHAPEGEARMGGF
ncbi:MAG TPA: nuclear transport factor 2 family protein [Candidatus Binataceae bacterium]